MVSLDNTTDIILAQDWIFNCFQFPLELSERLLTHETSIVNKPLTSKVSILPPLKSEEDWVKQWRSPAVCQARQSEEAMTQFVVGMILPCYLLFSILHRKDILSGILGSPYMFFCNVTLGKRKLQSPDRHRRDGALHPGEVIHPDHVTDSKRGLEKLHTADQSYLVSQEHSQHFAMISRHKQHMQYRANL